MEKVTLQMIADRCKVSKATVSMALNKPHKISKDVRDLVSQTAKQLGYSKTISPRGKKILLVFNRFKDHFYGDYYQDIIFGLFQQAIDEPFILQLRNDFDIEYADICDNQGIIFIGNVPTQWLVKAKSFNIPIVVAGHPVEERLGVPYVVPNFQAGYQTLIDYVMSCNHQDIGLVVGDFGGDKLLETLIINTFQNAINANGGSSTGAIEWVSYADQQTVTVALHKLLSRTPRPTSILFSDDQFAYRAILEAQRNGLEIPRDLSITGFDGIEFPSYVPPPSVQLTTVFVDRLEIATQTLNTLFSPSKRLSTGIIIPVHFRPGDSVVRL